MGYGVRNCVYTIGYRYIRYDMGMYGFISVSIIWDMGFIIVYILLDMGIYDMTWIYMICMDS